MVVAGGAGTAADNGFWRGIRDSFEKTFIRENRWRLIVDGLLVTLEITILAGLIGTILGFFICLWLRRRKGMILFKKMTGWRCMNGKN